jgi:hypothetical protein
VYQQPASGSGSARPAQAPSDYDQRLRSIEDTLKLLVTRKDQGFESDKQRSRDKAEQPQHLVEQGDHEVNSDEDVAILDEDEAQQQNTAEDSVDGMAAITDPEQRESRFFGPSSNISFLRHISDATSATLKSIGQSRQTEDRFHTSIVSRVPSPVTTFSDTSPVARSQYANIRSLPSESRALHLIRLFFSDTGMLFPYIHEQDILRTYSAGRRNRFSGVSRSWLCLVNVIFAFATYISARPDQSAERNAVESEVFIERAQLLSAEIEIRSANLETGRQQTHGLYTDH